MERLIPLSIPNFEGNEKQYVMDALDQGWVSTGGAYITRLEKDLARFLGAENVAACQSGTSALHLSLIEAGVGPGDVVLVPPLRRFCEEECRFEDGMLRWRDQLVKAIVVVHVFGNMADMESIMETAGRYGLKVIEDATEALGTHYCSGPYAGKYAGTIGDFGAFSFNGNKIITTGGGGAVTARDAKAVDHIRFLSTQAKTDPHYYIHDEIGYNYRMTNLQAALGVAQLEELERFILRKQLNYERYRAAFLDFSYCALIPFREGTDSNKWFYSLLIDRTRINESLREIILALREKGIETRAIWGLINEQKPYLKEECYQLEKAPYYASRILNIPSSTQITTEEIDYVADEVKTLFRRLANG